VTPPPPEEPGRPSLGPGTRAVHAGLPPAAQGEPLLPGPVLAAPYHLQGDVDAGPYVYGRYGNPTWTHLERALGELEAAEAVTFASGMAALSAVVLPLLGRGDVLVACGDGYPGIRELARERLEPLGIEVRLVPTDTRGGARRGARRDPRVDRDAVEPRASTWSTSPPPPRPRTPPARCWPSTTPWRPRSASGRSTSAPTSRCSAARSRSAATPTCCSGPSSSATPGSRTACAGGAGRPARAEPFEAWLAHRTLGLRAERQSATALALARRLRERGDVSELRHPGLEDDPSHPVARRQMALWGPLLAFALPSAERAQTFLAACALVSEATSFGGVHATAERRARWGTDAVPEGFIRFSAGCEDTADLLADVEQALDSVS
jgi:cystathionine gamma-lyase